MFDLIFSSIWSVYGTALVIVLACAAVLFAFPSLRGYALIVGASVMGVLIAFQKGRNTKARETEQKQKAAIDKLEKHYDEIDKRNTTDADVAKRLQRGDF